MKRMTKKMMESFGFKLVRIGSSDSYYYNEAMSISISPLISPSEFIAYIVHKSKSIGKNELQEEIKRVLNIKGDGSSLWGTSRGIFDINLAKGYKNTQNL